MCIVMVCLATAALGIDVGWQPLPGGGVEYLIQLGPQTLDALRSGELIQSDVPAEVHDIRAYRIMLGGGKLPRELPEVKNSDRPGPPIPPPQSPAIEPESSGPRLFGPPEAPPQTAAQPAPRPLPTEPAGKPLSAEKTAFVSQASAPEQAATKTADNQPQPTEQPQRPGTALLLVMLGLFASLGGNIFLAWVTWDIYRRYRALLRRPAALPTA